MEDKTTHYVQQASFLARRRIIWLAAGVSVFLLLLARTFVALGDDHLFTPVPGITPAAGGMTPSLRTQAVRVNWNSLDPRTDSLHLNLFSGPTLTATRERVEYSPTGGYVWIGELAGETGGRVSLSVQGRTLVGSIYRLGREWAVIRPTVPFSDGLYAVIQVDPNAPEPAGVDFVLPPAPTADDAPKPQGATCQEDGSIIDLMVAYTTAARDLMGGTDAITALVNQKVADMNTANKDSAAPFLWRLVRVMEVDYTEAGDLLVDLTRLVTNGDGPLDEVHEARDAAKADLTGLLVAMGANYACGYAFQMTNLDLGFASHSFAVSALDYPGDYTCSSLTMAHEFGHSLGNAHDRPNGGGSVLFPFSFGYKSPNGNFRDIMSYDCPNGCPRINIWSNPDVWFMGEPTGVRYETDPANAAELVRSMNGSRQTVSNFRTNCVDATPTPTPTITPPPPTPTATNTPGTPEPTRRPTRTPKPPKLTNHLFIPMVRK